MNGFFDLDFDKVYPTPTPQRLAEAYYNRLWIKMHIEHFSFLIIFYGKHRVGKSLSAVSFCYILDETFEPNMEKRIVYNSKGLIGAFKEIRQKDIHGAGIVVDEAGTGDLSSQRWYEDMAKMVSANLQAVGYLNPFVCFVTQNFSFINNIARKLSQGVFEVERMRNRYVNIKPFWIENNPWITGFYRKYPIFCESRDNIPSNVFKLSRIKIGLPPKDIVDRYIAHSQAYKDKLLSDSEDEIDAMEAEKMQKKMMVSGIEALAQEVLVNIDDYKGYTINKKTSMPVINEQIIRHRHGLSYRDAKLVKALVEQMLMKKRKRTTMPDEE
jgi:hypothetical protein